ncbi:hypothetical protein HT136_23255 [Novosphingobium profundi]|uniref:hypothetical protein n=1 Tax=Novosphingobium profundi TaxID=1774954 RepID=UPI001BD952ED|nr:hypothetical protein [Novosphingobium profundi]MBT0671293.1 hypothetical protein [Novosphingobium profundi]
MQLTTSELEQLADYLVFEADCSPEFEGDDFAITFLGVRCYVERYIGFFRVEVGHQDNVVELPRH